MNNLIIIDVETTQNPTTKNEEIIEFCGVEIDKHFNQIEELYLLINPNIPLTYITKKVTGITEQDLVDKLPLEKAFPKIIEFIGENIIIAHNASFEKKVFDAACNKCGLSYLTNQFVDSLKIAKKLFPNQKNSLYELKKRFDIN